jgi:hypothetical protein
LRDSGCSGLLIVWLAVADTFCEFCMITFQMLPLFMGPISMLDCFHLQWIAPWLQPNIQIALFAISLDRLFSVLCPMGFVYENFG